MAKSKRILFALRSVEHYPYVRSIVEALTRRGHIVHVIFDKRWSQGGQVRGLTYGWAKYSEEKWRKIIFYAQDILSWRRYFKVWGQSSFYRDRFLNFSPVFLQFFLKMPIIRAFLVNKIAFTMMELLVRWTPPEKEVVGGIKKFGPNVVVATPANMPFSSADIEYLRAAATMGIATVVPVFSWDNLTTKGIFPVKPDLLLAWNQVQIEEARRHHGINKKNIKICGAFLFDFWFDNLRPSQTREAFCKKWRLDANAPILGYLETSDSLTGDERWLVKELSHNLKNSNDLRLKAMQIIVRPHPFKSYFGNFKLPNVHVIPEKGTWPKDKESIQLYFDTLFFSFAVFGVNTSGFIDAVCCDKPIVTLNLAQYKKTQMETEHFKHLIENDVVEIANNWQDLTKILGKLVAGKDGRGMKRGDFVEKFIRPKGIDVAAGEVAAEEVEKIASRQNNFQ